MDKTECLKKVIEKAKKNGWETNIISVNVGHENEFIFDIDFAKAFWRKDWFDNFRRCSYCDGVKMKCGDESDHLRAWEVGLIKLALAKDRLEYLNKFIK